MNKPKKIEFLDPRKFLSHRRNYKAIAINVFGEESTRTIHIYPQNGHDHPGPIEIQIPFEAITAFILEINKYNPEPLVIDTSNCEHLADVANTKCNNCGQKGFCNPISFLKVKCEFCESEQEI